MKEKAHQILNRYFEAELGNSVVLPEDAELTRQRQNFLDRFGPQPLAAMSGQELLQELPSNLSNEEPMDYWLEFKNDEEFGRQNFGGIRGGSAAKFGAWQQKETGACVKARSFSMARQAPERPTTLSGSR